MAQLVEEIPAIAKPFYRYTKGQVFSVDTLRSSPYGKYLDPIHGYGGFFARLKQCDLVAYVGEMRSTVESNKGRKIDCWNWTTRADELFSKVEA